MDYSLIHHNKYFSHLFEHALIVVTTVCKQGKDAVVNGMQYCTEMYFSLTEIQKF